jgi:hypothetical protein
MVSGRKIEEVEMDSKRKIFYQSISLLLLIFIAILPFYKNFFYDGILVYVDMTFPLSIKRIFEIFTSAWNPYGSEENYISLMRLPWLLIFLLISEIFNFSIRIFLIFLFIGTFYLAGVSMYFLIYFLIENNKIVGKIWLKNFCSLVGALIYMFNPWSLNHLWTYFMYPTYAIFPLILLLLIKLVKSGNHSLLVLLAILLTLGSTDPHGVIMMFILILVTFLFFLTFEKEVKKVSIIKNLIVLISLYISLNAHWIIPYFFSLFFKPVIPPYLKNPASFNVNILNIFSKESELFKSIRLVGGWGLPINYPDDSLWILFSFSLPLLVFIFFILLSFKRDSILYLLLILIVFSLFLSKGTSRPFGEIYKYLVFSFPLVGWLFRAPDRWLIFSSLSYSIIIGLGIFYLLKSIPAKTNRKRSVYIISRVVFFVFLFCLIFYSFYPIVIQYSQNIFSPTKIPDEYQYLSRLQLDPNSKAIIFPVYRPGGFFYNWSNGKRLGPLLIYSFSISNLNTGTWLFLPDSFLFKLEKLSQRNPEIEKVEVNKTDCFKRLIAGIGVKYIVLDTTAEFIDTNWNKRSGKELLSFFLSSFGNPIFNSEHLYVFLNPYNSSSISVTDKVICVSRFEDLCFYSQLVRNPQTISIYLGNCSFLNFPTFNGFCPNLILNPSFELGYKNWSGVLGGKNFIKEIDNRTYWNGNNSIRITTNDNSTYNLGWVKSNEVIVDEGEWIRVVTHMKWENSVWSHIAIEGYNTSSNKWQQLIHCPGIQSGSSDWKEFSCSVSIPKTIHRIRVALAGGWSLNKSIGNGTTWFDDIEVYRLHQCSSINTSANNVGIESYLKINPTLWKVQVNATKPFMLSFAESYDPLWEARVYKDGKLVEKVKPVPLYGVINGFWINTTGDNLEIVIRYTPQDWFEIGLVISGTTFAFSLFYLFYDWRKSKKDKWALALEKKISKIIGGIKNAKKKK